jgi:hypothetical protein
LVSPVTQNVVVKYSKTLITVWGINGNQSKFSNRSRFDFLGRS